MDYVFGGTVGWDGSVDGASQLQPVEVPAFMTTADVLRDREAGIMPALAPESGGSVDYAALTNIFTSTTRALADAVRVGADTWAQISGQPTSAQRDALFQYQLASAAQQQQQQVQSASMSSVLWIAGLGLVGLFLLK